MLTVAFKTFLNPSNPSPMRTAPPVNVARHTLRETMVDAARSPSNPRAYADPDLERKRLEAIARLGERYIAHPAHAPKKGEHVDLPPEKQAELRGWIGAAEHLEQMADAIGGTAGAAYRDSAARLRARARDLFAYGVGV